MTEMKQFLGKRILFKERPYAISIIEATVLQISPKGFVKLEFQSGATQWIDSEDIDKMEILEVLDPVPIN